MTNYELDSDETLMKDINNHSFNKKQFNELLKTNDNNTIEEKENNSLSSESSEITFDKIIKEAQDSIKLNRNKKNDKKRINSAIENINNMKDINNYRKNNLSKSNDNKEKAKYVYKNINIENKNIKVYKKEKINDNNNKLTLPGMENNSYFYKKLKALIVKEDKVNKFINKKK